MAKFKVGDLVKILPGNGFLTGFSATVVRYRFEHTVLVALPNGEEHYFPESALMLIRRSSANSAPRSSNPVVQNALAAKNSAVAANAGDKKCKVTLETVTFNQGVKPETRHMSITELRTLLKMLGKGSDAEAFIQRLETSGATDIAINDVDLYAALI